eukprot:3447914-Amphidinium_carterae.2
MANTHSRKMNSGTFPPPFGVKWPQKTPACLCHMPSLFVQLAWSRGPYSSSNTSHAIVLCCQHVAVKEFFGGHCPHRFPVDHQKLLH